MYPRATISVRGSFTGNFAIGNQYGDYAVLALVAALTGKRLVFEMDETVFPMTRFFVLGSPSISEAEDRGARVFNRVEACDELTGALLGNGSVIIHNNPHPRRNATSLMLLPYCLDKGKRLWPDDKASRKLYALAGDPIQESRRLPFPPWHALLGKGRSTAVARWTRCGLTRVFSSPSRPLQTVFDQLVGGREFDILHVRTGITEDGTLRAISPTRNWSETWQSLNGGCTTPSRIMEKVAHAVLPQSARLIVISDSPNVCISLRQYGQRIDASTEVLCPTRDPVTHTVYNARKSADRHIQTARDVLLLMRAARVWFVSDSTFTRWATVRERPFVIERAVPSFHTKKKLPVCPDCEDGGSTAMTPECRRTRMTTLGFR